MPKYQELSDVLPPLILGVGVFNHQFNKDPFHLPTNAIVHKALTYGICAFDTSPYYGPSEEILGRALATPEVKNSFPREDYYIITKVGRIAGSEFDYSPDWIQYSVKRSLERLNTTYLDVVYCHDVEFVSKEEVLIGVKELRRIRSKSNAVRNVGISGYPVDILCELAEMVLEETGVPLDIVQSYCHQTLQNTKLNAAAVQRFKNAGVKIVPNASPLGMGLMRSAGVPVGSMGDFHPSPPGLRNACLDAAKTCEAHDERLETVALRYAIETWARSGSSVGTKGPLPTATLHDGTVASEKEKLGVTVLGCSYVKELDEAVDIWRSLLEDLGGTQYTPNPPVGEKDWTIERRKHVEELAKSAREALGDWIDQGWDSPSKDFVNTHVRQGP
jgi:D-arabinose 1-dehydrogenase